MLCEKQIFFVHLLILTHIRYSNIWWRRQRKNWLGDWVTRGKKREIRIRCIKYDRSLERKGLFWGVFFAVMEFELRASHLLGWCSDIWVTLPAVFMLGIFEIGSHKLIFQGWLQTVILLIAASWIGRKKSIFYCGKMHVTFIISHFNLFFFFWWDWGLSSGLHTCKAGALSLEPHFQSILFSLFWRWGSHELFAQAGLKP
jgi:hypothetical protein